MAGGRLCCLSCFFTCSAVLLLGVCLHDVEASSCQREVHKKVGDTVEFSSCLPTEWVSLARWRYRGLNIADKDKEVSEKHQFTGRLDLNPTDFSLTVRKLTLQDSGDFSFISAVNDTQRERVTITLQVHEPITEPPVLTGNSTWSTLTNSCTVFLECSSTSNSSVTYKWTVRNHTRSGSTLQYVIGEQDGDTQFTCTIQNVISEKTASKTMKCSNNTDGADQCGNRLTQSETVNHDETQQHVYSSLLHGDDCVYETMRGSADVGTGPEVHHQQAQMTK